MKKPIISVIMPLYNAEKHLSQAIKSILNQTFTNFEFIIIDDCSTDNSARIINLFKDMRISYYRNKTNLGLTKSLNIGLKNTSGKYIARMDADDISLKKRLEIQYNFLEINKEIGVCGSWYKNFKGPHKKHKTPVKSNQIKATLLFDSALGHPTVMMRKKIIKEYNIKYNEEYKKSQDFELWARLCYLTDFYNIPKVLLKYRVHKNQIGYISNSFYSDKVRYSNQLRLIKNLKIGKNETNICSNNHLFGFSKMRKNDFIHLENWIEFLIKRNETVSFYNNEVFAKVLLERFWRICKNYGMFGARYFFNSNLHKYANIDTTIRLKSFFYGYLPIKRTKHKI